MEQPGCARLTLRGGSRDMFVVTEPPVGLAEAHKDVDADLEVLRLESQENYVFVPALLVLLTGDPERALRTLGLAYDRLEAVQTRLAAENASFTPLGHGGSLGRLSSTWQVNGLLVVVPIRHRCCPVERTFAIKGRR